MADSTIWAWRHPRAIGTAGRCIGTTDVPVDRRKAKRLARRVQQFARKAGLPRVVFTSDLQRCAEVGRWLCRWGWTHHIDPLLRELDFGAWEGRAWSDIDRAEIDQWCCDFSHHAPGGGETLCAMLKRAASWQAKSPLIMIAHAGWMLARKWRQEGRDVPSTAQDWPASPGHGECWEFVVSPSPQGERERVRLAHRLGARAARRLDVSQSSRQPIECDSLFKAACKNSASTP